MRTVSCESEQYPYYHEMWERCLMTVRSQMRYPWNERLPDYLKAWTDYFNALITCVHIHADANPEFFDQAVLELPQAWSYLLFRKLTTTLALGFREILKRAGVGGGVGGGVETESSGT